MAQPYLGQIEAFAFNFAPRGWAFCAGQLLSIQQNQALFAVVGTTYGGNGTTTFALPDLRSRLAMGQGNGAGLSQRVIGQTVGEENHTLLVTETPQHAHSVNTAANAAPASNTDTPSNATLLAQTTGIDTKGDSVTVSLYVSDPAPNQVLAGTAIGVTGGLPHANLMPYNTLNFCIALNGIFPSRN
jgi:microcystin-dependent protein